MCFFNPFIWSVYVCACVCEYICIGIGVLHFMYATFMQNLFANVAFDLINL